MDQLKSNNLAVSTAATTSVVVPRRGFSLEFFVGLFFIAGVAATAYLAMGLGGLQLVNSNRYNLYAEFDNISGLQNGASVEIAGVPIGEVANITLKDPIAIVTLSLDRSVQIRYDDIASIRTKGIIGDRYVKISRGASNSYLSENGRLVETESVVDFEDIIGKIVHSLSGDKDEKSEKE